MGNQRVALTSRIVAACFVENKKGKGGGRPAAPDGSRFAGLWRHGNSHPGKPGQERRFTARLPCKSIERKCPPLHRKA